MALELPRNRWDGMAMVKMEAYRTAGSVRTLQGELRQVGLLDRENGGTDLLPDDLRLGR